MYIHISILQLAKSKSPWSEISIRNKRMFFWIMVMFWTYRYTHNIIFFYIPNLRYHNTFLFFFNWPEIFGKIKYEISNGIIFVFVIKCENIQMYIKYVIDYPWNYRYHFVLLFSVITRSEICFANEKCHGIYNICLDYFKYHFVRTICESWIEFF